MRFAPDLNEDMDINNLRIAIFNYILSKQKNKELLIRIDYINDEEKEKEILNILNLFSIEYSRVVSQKDNLKYHQKLAMQLMSNKKAFACFCSDEKLEELKKSAKKEKKTYSYDDFCAKLSDETVLNCNAPFTVRIKRPSSNIQFTDLFKGAVDFNSSDVDSFIILNHQKIPTYNYACSVDDMIHDISLVIRDEKHLLDTAKQLHIRDLLNYNKEIEYIHLPMVKFDKPVRWLIDEGYLPSAIANYLVLIGNNEASNDIFTLEEAIEWFDIKNISNNIEKFDLEKLKELNKKHLKNMDEMRLSKILGFADIDIGKLGKLFLDEACTIKDIKQRVEAVFTPKNINKDFIQIRECIKESPFFDDYNEFKKYIFNNTKLNEEFIVKALRYLLTGRETGPELSSIYPLIKNYLGEIIK